MIPVNLKDESFRFIRLTGQTKVPTKGEWKKADGDNVNKLSDPAFQKHIADGNNYGVLSGYGNLVMVDADHPETVNLLKQLPPTFTVKTGKKGFHAYYKCINSQTESNRVLKFNKADVGKILTFNSYVVGPGCTHPETGNKYKIHLDIPIQTLEWGLLEKVFAGMMTKEPLNQKEVLLQGVEAGSRNETLFKLACYHREVGLTQDECWLQIKSVNQNCNPPLDNKELEIIVKHAYSYEKKSKKELEQPLEEDIKPEMVIPIGLLLTKEYPPTEWLIEDFLEKGTINLVSGDGGSFKSYLMIYSAIASYYTKNFLNLPYAKEKLKVLYIDEEQGEKRLSRRCKKIINGFGNSDCLQNAKIDFMVDQAFKLDVTKSVFKINCQPLMLKIEGMMPDLIIFDSLARFMTGSEDKAECVRNIFDNIKYIAHKLNCCIVIIHHIRKITGKRPTSQDMRGSSDLRNQVDNTFLMHKKEANIYSIWADKPRDGNLFDKGITFNVIDTDNNGIAINFLCTEKETRDSKTDQIHEVITEISKEQDIDAEEVKISQVKAKLNWVNKSNWQYAQKTLGKKNNWENEGV